MKTLISFLIIKILEISLSFFFNIINYDLVIYKIIIFD
jgi:hypothetical protein